MTQNADLHARLLQEARNYDPAAYHRSLLVPYRDVLLLWRAKFMGYEQIAATLSSHGIKVARIADCQERSPRTVGWVRPSSPRMKTAAARVTT